MTKKVYDATYVRRRDTGFMVSVKKSSVCRCFLGTAVALAAFTFLGSGVLPAGEHHSVYAKDVSRDTIVFPLGQNKMVSITEDGITGNFLPYNLTEKTESVEVEGVEEKTENNNELLIGQIISSEHQLSDDALSAAKISESTPDDTMLDEVITANIPEVPEIVVPKYVPITTANYSSAESAAESAVVASLTGSNSDVRYYTDLDITEPVASTNSEATDIKVSMDEIELFERLVRCEAGTDDLILMILVANVVINRVNSPEFPNTITDVIMSPWQFEPVSTGWIYKVETNDLNKEAVARALAGEDYSQNSLYFFCREYTDPETAAWFDTLTKTVERGGEEFFTD